MTQVLWLDAALNDLKEIGRYIASEDPAAAYRALARIEAAANSLIHSPELGRPGRVPDTRELIVPGIPYILPYYIKNREVRILAVMHASRKWPDDFSSPQ